MDSVNSIVLVAVTALVNGGVTWGVVSTKLAWMRRDLDGHAERLLWLERKLASLFLKEDEA